MKSLGIFLFVCGGLVDIVLSHFYVTAPNILRFERDESVVVGILGEQNKNIEVWLENKDGVKFSQKNVFVPDQEHPGSTSVKVTVADIIGDKVRKNPKSVTLVAKRDGVERRADILLSYRTGHIVVQTDKPIYTPRQDVKVRVLAMDEEFKPAKTMNVSVDITSPSGVTFAKYHHDKGRNYFFDHRFSLPPFAETGIWTVRAHYGGQYKTDGRALFAVEEYVLPTFFVKIRLINSFYILPGEDESEINVEVTAEYVYKEVVRGMVELEISAVKDGELEAITKLRGDLLDNDGQRTYTIKKSDLCRYYSKACDVDRFPAGYRLQIVARVTEGATGNQEAVKDESIIFAKEKYMVSFDRSKTSYRSGMMYLLKLDLKYANGQVASNKDLFITMVTEDGKQEKMVKTDEHGRCSQTFSNLERGNLEFKVAVDMFKSAAFTVKPFEGRRQVSVEHVTANGVEMLRAYTNGQRDQDSGLVFLIVSNGQVIHTEYVRMQTIINIPLSERIKQKIKSPNARLIVAFVDEGNTLVADATKFSLEKKCEGNGLTLKADRNTVEPDDSSDLTVSGDPLMLVGLNIMDSALLHVPNKQEILTVDKMMEVLDEHDIGCGEGSGVTGESVFKNSGLVILTDAGVKPDLLERKKVECTGKQRAKRSINEDECFGDVRPFCCERASEFARDEHMRAEHNGTVIDDTFTLCLNKIQSLADDKTDDGKILWPSKCMIAFFKRCVHSLDVLQESDRELEGKSLSETDRYTTLMAMMAKDGLPADTKYIRDNFAESWEFNIKELDNEGSRVVNLKYPDSITTWMIQAIGITENNGFCVAETESVKAFRDFFLQVDLPYKAIRLEKTQIKATIFYYGDDERTINVFLDYNPDYCSNSKLDEKMMIRVDMKPKSAETVMFPIIPIKQGRFDVVLHAISYKKGNMKLDGVKKQLYVVNEGVEEKINIKVCLDPLQQKKDCVSHQRATTEYGVTKSKERIQYSRVNLGDLGDLIPGTVSVLGRLSTNVMEDVVQILIDGVDKLFIQPMGCGEQTVLRLAPNVYAMQYLRTTDRVTSKIEEDGHGFIQDGVRRELGFRKSDGSYSAWAGRTSSTWLTAFVSKVFCQARNIDSTVAPLIDQNMPKTIKWLTDRLNNDGSFDEPLKVIHREMIGQINENDPTLTAFVIISLAECDSITKGANKTIETATNSLIRLKKSTFKENPYLLAITTYALALTNHDKKWEFKKMLLDIKNESRNGAFWGQPGGEPANANSIETTSYALLALLLFDDIATAEDVFSWLTLQRGVEGSFRTTQDTVVGLQALTAYTIKTDSPNVALDVEIRSDSRANNWRKISLSLNKEHAKVVEHTQKLDVTADDTLMHIDVKGTGTGVLTIDLRFNRPRRDHEECRINMSPVEVSEVDEQMDHRLANRVGRKCDQCGHCEEDVAENAEEIIIDREDEPLQIMGMFGRRRRNAQVSQAKKCIKFNVSARNGAKYGMSIVKFWLETGQAAVQASLESLKTSGIIDHYEVAENGKGYVTFYLSKIDEKKIQFTFILKDSFPGNHKERQPAAVEVYDYYNPEIKCTQYYSTSGSHILDQEFQCDDNVCQCMQNMCAKDYKGTLTDKKKMKKPVMALVSHTCNFKKADYAVKVKINTTANVLDKKSGLVTAQGVVVRDGVINKGAENLRHGSEMTFKWRPECPYLMDAFDKTKGEKEFYIIGKDGFKVKDGNGESQYIYELMNTAIVLQDARNPRSRFSNIMKTYAKYMKKPGCGL